MSLHAADDTCYVCPHFRNDGFCVCVRLDKWHKPSLRVRLRMWLVRTLFPDSLTGRKK